MMCVCDRCGLSSDTAGGANVSLVISPSGARGGGAGSDATDTVAPDTARPAHADGPRASVVAPAAQEKPLPVQPAPGGVSQPVPPAAVAQGAQREAPAAQEMLPPAQPAHVSAPQLVPPAVAAQGAPPAPAAAPQLPPSAQLAHAGAPLVPPVAAAVVNPGGGPPPRQEQPAVAHPSMAAYMPLNVPPPNPAPAGAAVGVGGLAGGPPLVAAGANGPVGLQPPGYPLAPPNQQGPYVQPYNPAFAAGRGDGAGRGAAGRGRGKGGGAMAAAQARIELVLRKDAEADNGVSLGGFNVQPARNENGLVRRGVERSPMRGWTSLAWEQETGVPIVLQPDVRLPCKAARIFIDAVLRHAPNTYAQLQGNGRLTAIMTELEVLGEVPTTLLMFDDRCHIVDGNYNLVPQGVLVVETGTPMFTWAITNTLRDLVKALAGTYSSNIYVSTGMVANPQTGTLARDYWGPHELWHTKFFDGVEVTVTTNEGAKRVPMTWERMVAQLRHLLEGYGAAITVVDGRGVEPVPVPALQVGGASAEQQAAEAGPYGAFAQLPGGM